MLIRDEQGVRWLPLGAVVAAVVLVGVLAYQRWWPADSANEVAIDEVLDRYREQLGTVPAVPVPAPAAGDTAASGTPPASAETAPASVSTHAATTAPTAISAIATTAPVLTTEVAPATVLALPAPGVYRYATEGREHITALGGTEHAYPAETTITVTPEGCGVHLRWDLLAERYEEWNLCIEAGAVVLQSASVQFHEFYGQAQTDVADCQKVVVLNPPPPPGTTIERDCRLAGEPWNPVWTATGTGTALVSGDAVATPTFAVTIELTGEHPEHSVQHWAVAPNGLPVTIEFDMESANPSPVGAVTYTETLTATLVSLDPLR